MPYRRPPQNNKRFFPPLFPLYNNQSRNNAAPFEAFTHRRDYLDIPLPNEKEFPDDFKEDKRLLPNLSSIVDFIRQHIKVEELILIGLIILMLDESFDDQLLLVILIYILLF